MCIRDRREVVPGDEPEHPEVEDRKRQVPRKGHPGQVPQGWQWVEPKKEFDAMLTAIRAGLLSRSEAISAFGYDAEDIDREIAADNQRADALGLVFDSDPRHDKAPQPSTLGAPMNAAATVTVPQDQQNN